MKDDLGDRMKGFFEDRAKSRLLRKVPVIIRVDGKSFHVFCKRFERPYDEFFNQCMNGVAQLLCSNIQGAKLGERHSDEISILVTDYDKIGTDAYFDYEIQKITSVVASMATAEFIKRLLLDKPTMPGTGLSLEPLQFSENWPIFDCRCFNIPEVEIPNYFWWRLGDATRNSINMLAQSKFSHKQLQGKTCNEMQEMLFTEYGINWNNIPQGQKSGFICRKYKVEKEVEEGPNQGQFFFRNVWKVSPSPSNLEGLRNILDSILEKE